MANPNFIFFNGKSCVGKDTQAHLLHKELGETALELSTGDIFRGAKSGQGEYSRFHDILAPYVVLVEKQGSYIPDEPIVQIVKTIVSEKIEEGIVTFIFTGFPRTLVQLKLVDEMVSELEGTSTHIFYDASDDTVRERAKNRRENDLREGRVPREDDDSAVVERKLITYQETTYPMLLVLDQEGRLLTINAEGTIPEIERETSICFSKERL